MPSDETTSLERWRGQMDARLDNLVKALDRQHDDFQESEKAASSHRESLRTVIAALSQSVATLAESVKTLRPELLDTKAIVTGLEADHNRAQGFVWALRGLWAMIGGLVGGAVTTAATYFLRH